MEHEERLRIARRRAGAKFGLLIHLTVFIAVNTLLFALDQRAAPGVHRQLFPLGGWAIGLAIHGLAVFLSGSEMRERMIEHELRKLDMRPTPGSH